MSSTKQAQPGLREYSSRGPVLLLDACVAHLMDDVRAVRAAVAIYESAPEPSKAYAAELRSALDMFERELTMTRAASDARDAESVEDVRAAMERLARDVQSWFEEIAVRGRLGGTEARDRFEDPGRRIEVASEEARRAIASVVDGVERDVDQVRLATCLAVDEVRATVRDASEACRVARN